MNFPSSGSRPAASVGESLAPQKLDLVPSIGGGVGDLPPSDDHNGQFYKLLRASSDPPNGRNSVD